MVAEKLAGVLSDFDSLGLREVDGLLTPESITLHHLRTLASSTENIGKTTTPGIGRSNLQSSLGLRLFEIIHKKVVFKPPGYCNPCHVGCHETEVKLHDTINQETNGKIPIIVTHEKIPVAIIKVGDLVAYGIEDVPDFGILKGVFSSVQRAIKLQTRRAAPKPHSPHSIDASFFKGFSPIRIALSEFDNEIVEAARSNTPASYGTFTHNPATIHKKVVKLNNKAICMTNGQAEELYKPTGLHWNEKAA